MLPRLTILGAKRATAGAGSASLPPKKSGTPDDARERAAVHQRSALPLSCAIPQPASRPQPPWASFVGSSLGSRVWKRRRYLGWLSCLEPKEAIVVHPSGEAHVRWWMSTYTAGRCSRQNFAACLSPPACLPRPIILPPVWASMYCARSRHPGLSQRLLCTSTMPSVRCSAQKRVWGVCGEAKRPCRIQPETWLQRCARCRTSTSCLRLCALCACVKEGERAALSRMR